jgi:hypothetical protein
MPEGPHHDPGDLDVEAMLRDISLIADSGPDPFSQSEAVKAQPLTILHLLGLVAMAALCIAVVIDRLSPALALMGVIVIGMVVTLKTWKGPRL